MNTITLDSKALAAVRLFAAKQDVRYYLNSVLIEATRGKTRIVATNGHYLTLCDTFAPNDIEPEFVSVLIPTEAIDSLKLNHKYDLPVVLKIDGADHSISQGATGVTFKPIDGRFPDYARVIPEKVSNEPGHYNADYMAVFTKAQKLFSKTLSPVYWQNGTGAGLVQLQETRNLRFVGVLMPVRTGETVAPSTSFARESLQPKPAPVATPETADNVSPIRLAA